MFLNDPLAVIGVFLLGAASGACLKYARYRGLVALCNRLLAETSTLHTSDGMLMNGHFGQSRVEEGSMSRSSGVELPISRGAELSTNEIAGGREELNREKSFR